MNTKKTVFNKLAEIAKVQSELELSSEKIELATISELNRLTEELQKTWKTQYPIASDALYKAQQHGVDFFANYKIYEQKINKAIDEIVQSAKELGLQAKDIKEISAAEDTIKRAAVAVNKLKNDFKAAGSRY